MILISDGISSSMFISTRDMLDINPISNFWLNKIVLKLAGFESF